MLQAKFCAGLVAALISVVVAGCADLPGQEAGAFRDLANASESAFNGAAQTEESAVRDYAGLVVESGEGKLRSEKGCGAKLRPGVEADKLPQCYLTLRFRDAQAKPVEFRALAPKFRQRLLGIKAYGATMAELAEAKDLDEEKASAKKALGAVQGLAAVAGLPIPSAVIDIGVDIWGRVQTEQRRSALLKLAKLTQPLIDKVAGDLTEDALALQRNIEAASFYRLVAAETKLTAGRRGVRHQLVAKEMFDATADLNSSRRMKTDFSGLSKAHAGLVDALEHPEVDLASAIADIRTFIEELKAVEAAFNNGSK